MIAVFQHLDYRKILFGGDMSTLGGPLTYQGSGDVKHVNMLMFKITVTVPNPLSQKKKKKEETVR